MARGKKYRNALASFDRDKAYSWEEGIKILKGFPTYNYDPTVELCYNLGIDGRQARPIATRHGDVAPRHREGTPGLSHYSGTASAGG